MGASLLAVLACAALAQGAAPQSGFQPFTNVPGRFPETEWIISRTNAARFFKLGR